jgi:predicted transposase/invertase (TIGR01784 family)
MMYLEKNKDEKKLREVIKNVVELIKEENILDVKMFARWINRIFEKNLCDEEIEKIRDITEVKSMLETLVENIKEEGIKEGIKETEISIARKMLKEKFPIEMIEKITGLSVREIEELK